MVNSQGHAPATILYLKKREQTALYAALVHKSNANKKVSKALNDLYTRQFLSLDNRPSQNVSLNGIAPSNGQ